MPITKFSSFFNKSFLNEVIVRFVTSVLVGLIPFSLLVGWSYIKISRLQSVNFLFQQLQQSHLTEKLNVRDFLINDLNNAEFYAGNKSIYLSRVAEAHMSFVRQLKELSEKVPDSMNHGIAEMAANENRYNKLFSQTIDQVKK